LKALRASASPEIHLRFKDALMHIAGGYSVSAYTDEQTMGASLLVRGRTACRKS